MSHTFQTLTLIPHPINDVFRFFSKAANLQRITPPELRFQILTPQPVSMGKGVLIDYRLQLYGVPFKWSSLITLWDPPFRFMDVQNKGPYKEWIHHHRFSEKREGTKMIDEVFYQLPLWPFGEIFYPLIHNQIRRIFRFREKAIQEVFRAKT